MFIDITTTFRDGQTTYYAGERVNVPDEDAARFVGYGWASVNGKAAPLKTGQSVDLEIHSGQIGHLSEVM